MKFIDLTGKKFGRLTVIKRGPNKGKRITWLCNCKCGNNTYAVADKLKRGHTKSCGCYRNEFKALPKGEAAFNNLFRQYTRVSSREGREFKLSRKSFRSLITKPCFYCGAQPSTIRDVSKRRNGDRQLLYNGLDRMDNKKGYTNKNAVPCCPKCNYAKHDMTYHEFIDMCRRVCSIHYDKSVR